MNLDKSNTATPLGTDKIVVNRQDVSEYTCTLNKISDYVVANVPTNTLPYKSYVALVSQSNFITSAIVLENTLGIVPTYTTIDAQNSTITAIGAFPVNKTVWNNSQYLKFDNPVGGISSFSYSIKRLSNDEMSIYCGNGYNTLLYAIVDIRVYN